MVLSLRPPPCRLIELGCGNGATAALLHELGYAVTAIDESESGIGVAKQSHEGVRFEVASVYEDLRDRYGEFPLLLSLEVIEHLMSPQDFLNSIWQLLQPGGYGVISTPYHGYWKNLGLALTGRLDAHFAALWEGGHVKFFSVATLSQLLRDRGFENLRFQMAGRFAPFWKSMLVSFRKPAEAL